MLKKLLVTGAILASATTVALANGTPYVGAGLGIKAIGGERYTPFNVFAGYGAIVSPGLYLAGELNADITSANLSDTDFFKTTYGLGASVIPGLMLSDNTMLYGRLGLVRAKFRTPNSLENGGQLGVGLQTRVTQNLDLRGEYIYTKYSSFSYRVDGVKINISSPTADQFNLALVYKFE